MVIKSGLIVILRLCAILLSKLLSWLLLVVCVCGMIIFHYLLLFIHWLLRLTEEDGQPMVTDHDTPQLPVNTATDKEDILPLELNCIDADNQNAMNMAENAVSDNDDEDNSTQCSSDTDDIADDDELQHPVSCDSDSRGEQVLVIASPVLNVKEKLDKSVECTEENSPQHLVLTVCKITEEWRMQALQEKKLIQTVQNFQEDTGPAVDNCDDSESEDEADCLDYHEQEEEFKFYGAVPKSDDSGTTEAIMTVEQHHNVIESDDRLASHAEPAEEAVQGHIGEGVNGEEVNNDSGNQQATSTISSSVAHGTFPNSTTPND